MFGRYSLVREIYEMGCFLKHIEPTLEGMEPITKERILEEISYAVSYYPRPELYKLIDEFHTGEYNPEVEEWARVFFPTVPKLPPEMYWRWGLLTLYRKEIISKDSFWRIRSLGEYPTEDDIGLKEGLMLIGAVLAATGAAAVLGQGAAAAGATAAAATPIEGATIASATAIPAIAPVAAVAGSAEAVATSGILSTILAPITAVGGTLTQVMDWVKGTVSKPMEILMENIPKELRPLVDREITEMLRDAGVPEVLIDIITGRLDGGTLPYPMSLPSAEELLLPQTVGFFGDISAILVKLWESLIFFLSKIGTSIVNFVETFPYYIRDIYDVIRERLASLVQGVMEGLSWVNRAIWDGIQWLSDRLQDTWQWLWSKIRETWQWVTSNIMQGFNWLWGAIETGGRWVWDGLQAFARLFWEGIQYMIQAFNQYHFETHRWLEDWFYHQYPEVAERLNQSLYASIGNVAGSLGTAWQVVWEDMKLTGNRAEAGLLGAFGRGLVGKFREAGDWFQERIQTAWTSLEDMIRRQAPMTPEKAPALAGATLGAAVGFGVSAHVISLAAEAIHPLKAMGVHYLSAFLARMGQFSWIAGATMGVYVALGIRQPFTYYVNELLRPLLPDDRWLTIMAVKPDIDMPTFRKGMAYLGYPEKWIDKIQRTMYHEPRYFELKMMSEDEAATDEWLFEKSRRAGFTEDDSKIMVSSYIKTATRTQRLDLYKQLFNMYKESYINDDQFARLLEPIEFRSDALKFAKAGAKIAAAYDYISDMKKLYTDMYLKDMVSTFELELALTSLGIGSDKVYLLVRQAQIRKTPKPRAPVPKTVEDEMAKLQTKYATLYQTQYRKDLITRDQYLSYLLQLEISPELAEVTVAIEEARKAEVPAP